MSPQPGRTDSAAPPNSYRNGRAWASLLLGLFAVGAGIGIMLDGGLGVSPADVFFSGLADTTGWTVGTIVVASYFVMVAATYPFGIKPRVGTLLSVLLIGPSVDLLLFVGQAIGVTSWSLLPHIAWWTLGLAVFTCGVVGLFAANLGVSPYDQVTQAVAKVTRRTLGVARFVVDGTFLIVGLLLGGAWGVGTVILLLVVPVALNRALPNVRAVVAGNSPATARDENEKVEGRGK